MTSRILWTLSLLLLSPSTLFAQSAVIAEGGGNAIVTAGDLDGWATHVVFDFADGVNQIDVAHVSGWVDARTSVPLSLAFSRDPCKTYQVDTFWGLAPAGRYTMSDVGNVQLLASRLLPPVSNCRLAPPEPQPKPQPQCGPPLTFTFGGSPSIAKFEPDYPTPFLPEYLGPFYFYVPVGRYHITAWTGDNHVGPGGKNDGPQLSEIGVFWFDNGTFVLPPTNDVPDDANSVLTDFGVHALTTSVQTFYFLHAGPPGPPERANSFYPLVLTFTCVEDGQ